MEPNMAVGERRFNVWGVLFVAMGLWWAAGEIGIVRFEWGLVGPLALVAVGVSMLLGRGC